MEFIPKLGIIVGIAAVLVTLPLMMMSLSDQISSQYGALFVDQDAILEEFKGFESYLLFKEKYPESYDKDRLRRDGSVRLEVQALDFNTGNRIELDIRYDRYDDEIRQNVHCDINDRRYQDQLGSSGKFVAAYQSAAPEPEPNSLPGAFLKQGHAEDEFVVDFIKFTNCLELGDEQEEPTPRGTNFEPAPESEPSR